MLNMKWRMGLVTAQGLGGEKSDVWLILDTKTTWFILGKFGDAWLHKGRKLSPNGFALEAV